MNELPPTIKPGMVPWFYRFWLRHRNNRVRTAQQQTQLKKNVDQIVTTLIDSAQQLLLSPSSLFVRIDRQRMFGALSSKAIVRLIKAELNTRVVSYQWREDPTDDPAIFKVAITDVVFIHDHPVVRS